VGRGLLLALALVEGVVIKIKTLPYNSRSRCYFRASVATYNPARALADEVYCREIGKPAGPKGCRILFTSGGAGSGKTTAIEALLADSSNAANYFDILVDGTLSDFNAARSKIRQALALGHSVTIIHVNREFLETVRMVVKRAVQMGRVVALEDIAVTRFRSQEAIFKLQSEFSGKINIRVLENLTNASPSEIGLDYLGKKRAKSIDEFTRTGTNSICP
jgi:hypothetical protein